jgi:phosphate transport system protein
MRSLSLTSQLSEVRSLLRAMSDRVFAAMGVIRSHLEAPDKDELMKVILLDNEVDKLEKAIDQRILYIFATQQPLGQELREAYASVKIAHQIERIGDAVESLARQLASGEAQSIDRNRLINRMLAASMALFQASYRAMFEGDFPPVVDIYVKDDEVDRLHRSVYTEAKRILHSAANEAEVDSALQLINIGNKLEKIADISCNWAEQIDFSLHGSNRRRIKRRPQRIVVADSQGGLLASLAASMLSLPRSASEILDPSLREFEVTLATTGSEAGIVSLSRAATALMERRGFIVEALPVIRLEAVNWERALVAVFLGPDFKRGDHFRGQTKHKVVDLFWPEIALSQDLCELLLDGENKPPESKDVALLEMLLERLSERTSGLAAVMGRIQGS